MDELSEKEQLFIRAAEQAVIDIIGSDEDLSDAKIHYADEHKKMDYSFRRSLICAALTGLVDSMEYFPEKLAKEAIGYADAVLKILEEEE